MTRTSRYLIGESVNGRSTPSDVIHLRLLYPKDISARGDVQIFALLCLAFSGCHPNIIHDDSAIGSIEVGNYRDEVFVVIVHTKAMLRSFFLSLFTDSTCNLRYLGMFSETTSLTRFFRTYSLTASKISSSLQPITSFPP